MAQNKKEFTGTPEDFGKMQRIQDTATKLVKEHLEQPFEEMLAKGCSDLEISCALIALGYHILRCRRSEKNAITAFDTLAHFGRQQLETGRARYMAAKAPKLH